jgi:hypothetical protein
VRREYQVYVRKLPVRGEGCSSLPSKMGVLTVIGYVASKLMGNICVNGCRGEVVVLFTAVVQQIVLSLFNNHVILCLHSCVNHGYMFRPFGVAYSQDVHI